MPSKFIRTKLSVFSIVLMAAITPLVLVSNSGYTQTPPNAEQIPSNGEGVFDKPMTAPEECSKPAGDRQGAWFCLNMTSADARETAAAAQRDLGTEVVSNAAVEAAATGGHCTNQGCWSILNDYTTSYTGSGFYGYGRTTLGKASMYFKVTAKGTQLTIGPTWFRSTRGTLHPELQVEVLYISAAYPGGNSQKPMQSAVYSYDGILNAGNYLDWSKPYPAWRQIIQVPTVVVEPVWRDTSSAYPGRWYMYAKSIKFGSIGVSGS
jgi:hypothetical protein